MEELGYTAAIDTTWIKGTFGYFGFTNRTLHLLNGSTGSENRRKDLLDRAYQTGAGISEP